MNCDLDEIPFLGLLGVVMHKVMHCAKGMYQEFDLNRSMASILFTLNQRESLSQKELARSLNVTAPSITSSIQKMERSGYITRQPDKEDQRVMRLSLTEKGRSCVQGVKTVADQMEKLILQGMNTEEKLLLRRLMLQIYENLEQNEPDKKCTHKTERKDRV